MLFHFQSILKTQTHAVNARHTAIEGGQFPNLIKTCKMKNIFNYYPNYLKKTKKVRISFPFVT